jgi:hypothetical protein
VSDGGCLDPFQKNRGIALLLEERKNFDIGKNAPRLGIVDMDGPGVMVPCLGFNKRAGVAVLSTGDRGMMRKLMTFHADNIGSGVPIGIEIMTIRGEDPVILPDDNRWFGKGIDQFLETNRCLIQSVARFWFAVRIQKNPLHYFVNFDIYFSSDCQLWQFNELQRMFFIFKSFMNMA